MPVIFISYRRADTLNDALALERHFGKGLVFYDIEELKPGMEWPDTLKKKVREAKVTLVLYGGEKWLGIEKWGKRRIDDPKDVVKQEVEMALSTGATVAAE